MIIIRTATMAGSRGSESEERSLDPRVVSVPLREPPILPSIRRLNSTVKVLLEKSDVTDPHLFTKSLTSYGPLCFVMVFTRGGHSSLS